MKRQFQVICWNSDFKRGYREALGLMTKRKQDEIFERNKHIRQKIAGCLLSLVSLGILIWFTSYDLKLIWWGCELVPLMMIGFWLMLTDKLVMEEIEE